MPPVFGPASPSPTRLKSCAGDSGSTQTPSVTANSDTSGPSRNSSITTCAHDAAWRSASSRSVVTTTPLPAARPSSLTTYGGPSASSAAAAWSAVVATKDRAVGTPAAPITSLANAFDPSSRAAAADGPKQAMPAARTASPAPATSGPSGPMTTRSAPSRPASAAAAAGSARSSGSTGTSAAMPAFPGAATTSLTSGSARSERTRACSRAPPPTTSTFTGPPSRLPELPPAPRARRRVLPHALRPVGWRGGRGAVRARAVAVLVVVVGPPAARQAPHVLVADRLLQLRVVALQPGRPLDRAGQLVGLGHHLEAGLVDAGERHPERDLPVEDRQLDPGVAVAELAGGLVVEHLDLAEDAAHDRQDRVPLLPVDLAERARVTLERLLDLIEGVLERLTGVASQEV